MQHFDAPRSELRISANIYKIYNHLQKYGFAQGLVFAKDSREYIGRAGLTHLDFREVPEIELGYFLFEKHWGKGYATELAAALLQYAFEVLDKEKVYATVSPDIIASCRVAEKVGMVIEKEDIYETHNKRVRFYAMNKADYLARGHTDEV